MASITQSSVSRATPGYYYQGSTSLPCPIGTYGTDGIVCNPCPAATWAPLLGQTRCDSSYTYSHSGSTGEVQSIYIPLGVSKINVRLWGGGNSRDRSRSISESAKQAGNGVESGSSIISDKSSTLSYSSAETLSTGRGGDYSSCNISVSMDYHVYIIVGRNGLSNDVGDDVTNTKGRSAVQVVLGSDAVTAAGVGGSSFGGGCDVGSYFTVQAEQVKGVDGRVVVEYIADGSYLKSHTIEKPRHLRARLQPDSLIITPSPKSSLMSSSQSSGGLFSPAVSLDSTASAQHLPSHLSDNYSRYAQSAPADQLTLETPPQQLSLVKDQIKQSTSHHYLSSSKSPPILLATDSIAPSYRPTGQPTSQPFSRPSSKPVLIPTQSTKGGDFTDSLKISGLNNYTAMILVILCCCLFFALVCCFIFYLSFPRLARTLIIPPPKFKPEIPNFQVAPFG